MLGQGPGVRKAGRLNRRPDAPKRLVTKLAVRHQAQLAPKLRVVTQHRMSVEWQVVGQQVDVMREQQRKPLFHPAGHARVLPLPEQPMVHQNRIGLRRDGRFDQGTAGGHTRDQAAHLCRALDLKPVGAVVLEALWLQQGIQSLDELLAIGHGSGGGGLSGLGARAGAPSDIVGGFFVAFIGAASALAWRCGLYGDDVA